MWNTAMNGFEGFGGFGGFGMFFGPLFMIGIPLLILWFLVTLVRSATGRREAWPPASPSSSALELLKERYARGEIDEHEYNQRKKTLLE